MFSFHKYKLNVILYNSIRFIRLAQKFRPVGYLIRCIGDFVPDNRIQIVEADAPADHAGIRMKRKHQMTAKIAPGNADIADHAYQSAPWNKDTINMAPDPLQFFQEGFIVLNVPQLVRVFIITLQVPIRR